MTTGETSQDDEERAEVSTNDNQQEEVGSGHEQSAAPGSGSGNVPGHGSRMGRYNDSANEAEPHTDSGPRGRDLERRGWNYPQRNLTDREADRERQQYPLFPSSIVERAEYYSGPLPQPEVLAHYREAGADFPERIMRMAEQTLAASIENDRRESRTASWAVGAGVAIVGTVTVLSIVVAVILALHHVDYWWLILALPVFTAIPRIIKAVKGIPDDSTEDEQPPDPPVS